MDSSAFSRMPLGFVGWLVIVFALIGLAAVVGFPVFLLGSWLWSHLAWVP